MTRSLSALVCLCLLSWLGLAAEATACIHAQQASSAEVSQAGQQILVLHDGTVQTTVLRVQFDATAALADLAMVVPVPAIPTRCATAESGLFEALGDWALVQRDQLAAASARERGVKAAPAAPPTLQLYEVVETGPYEIQPIEARGKAGVLALNAWLSEHGYAKLPIAALGYYVEHEYAFLAVRAVPPAGETLKSGALPPLSFSFPSEVPIVPLRLEAQGTFPVRIYLVTRDEPADAAFRGASAKGFEVASTPSGGAYLTAEGAPAGALHADVGAFDATSVPAALAKVLKNASMNEGQLHARVLYADAFGSGVAAPSTWSDDLIIGELAGPTPQADGKQAPREPKADEPAPADQLPLKGVDPRATRPKSLPKKGCACTTADAAPWSLAWMLLLPVVRRRR